jgi:hypothetical protein
MERLLEHHLEQSSTIETQIPRLRDVRNLHRSIFYRQIASQPILFCPLFRSSNTHFTSLHFTSLHFTSLHPCSFPNHRGPHLIPNYALSPRIAVPSTRSPHTYQGSKWTGGAIPHSTPPSTTPRPASSRHLGTEFRGQYGLIFIAGINILHPAIDSISSFNPCLYFVPELFWS